MYFIIHTIRYGDGTRFGAGQGGVRQRRSSEMGVNLKTW